MTADLGTVDCSPIEFTMSASAPNPINVAVGLRIKAVRCTLGQTQVDLGRGIGVSFQQIQKYERGANRVSASTLYAIASHLQVSVAALMGEAPCPRIAPDADVVAALGTPALVRAWSELDDRRRRLATRIVIELASRSGRDAEE